MTNLPKHLRLTTLVAMFAVASSQLDAQIGDAYYHDVFDQKMAKPDAHTYYYDVCNQKTAKLIVMADANFNAKKMKLDFRNFYDSGNLAEYGLFKDAFEAALSSAAVDALKTYAPSIVEAIMESLPKSVVNFIPYAWIATVANILHNFYVNSTHVRERNYLFVAPVDGYYKIKVWVPGDWDKPCSTIKVYSINTSTNTPILKHNYDKSNASDRTETISVNLPAGLVHVSVSIGSGTLFTHTAGRMVESMLDNNSYVQWTVPSVPVAVAEVNIGNSLPYIGSTCAKNLSYANPGNPSNLIDGTVSYSNHQALAVIQPLPKASATRTFKLNPDDYSGLEWPQPETPILQLTWTQRNRLRQFLMVKQRLFISAA